MLDVSLHVLETDSDYGPAGPGEARYRQAAAEVPPAPPSPPPFLPPFTFVPF